MIENETEPIMIDFNDEYEPLMVANEVNYTEYLTLQYAMLNDISTTLHHIDKVMVTTMFCVVALWLFMVVRMRGHK